MRRLALLPLAALLLGFAPSRDLGAQERLRVRLQDSDEATVSVEVETHRGYAAVPASLLERVGWTMELSESAARLRLPGRARLELTAGTPFFTWDGELFQLVEAPYFFGGRLYLPLQLVSGFLPRRLAHAYDFEARDRVLTVRDPGLWRAADRAGSGTAGGEGRAGRARRSSERASGGEAPARVVVIDAGHGGRDLGARGPGGVLEKDVALRVARALARELEGDEGLEVHLTRDSDVFVPLWQRGEMATSWKGDRVGIFVSLHTNAAARSRSVRGFETYFLSEARTEHERRVAALENAPLRMESSENGAETPENPDLGFILKDLRNSDHIHWSSELAEGVQEALDPVHPGPNRGVKQGPFAVITNALMPGVLVEMGFITNPSEARLLNRRSFQEDAARSLARAIRGFFDRYPPGEGWTAGDRR